MTMARAPHLHRQLHFVGPRIHEKPQRQRRHCPRQDHPHTWPPAPGFTPQPHSRRTRTRRTPQQLKAPPVQLNTTAHVQHQATPKRQSTTTAFRGSGPMERVQPGTAPRQSSTPPRQWPWHALTHRDGYTTRNTTEIGGPTKHLVHTLEGHLAQRPDNTAGQPRIVPTCSATTCIKHTTIHDS